LIRNLFRIVFYLAGFITVGVIAVFLILEVIGLNRTVTVPSLIGMDVSEARGLLEGKGLSLKVEGEEYDAEVPEGHIMRQDVKPGEEVGRGTVIKIFISKGANILSMPSFEGQPLEDVKLTLINLGLETGRITWVHSDTVEKGRIIAQRPLPGNVGSNKVNFLVSLGPYDVSYKCPSFVNLTIDDARALADRLGLRLIEREDGGRVIFQKPEAGVIVKRGDTVEVTLGRGWGLWF
jgi:serine/threonine-protein kinase